MRHYSLAYDDRYRQVHDLGLAWFSDTPTPIVLETVSRYGLGKTARMLEIGCGEGRDAACLLKAGFDLLATDLSEEAVRWCRETYPQFQDQFRILDCLQDSLEEKFDMIYAVAVLHMLVRDADRERFYRFFREHLAQGGIGLICTMGDGKAQWATEVSEAFSLGRRTHQQTGRVMELASTSCRVVSTDTFCRELEASGLQILELGMTEAPPDFSDLLYAVIRK